jgi:hypothetical protein
VTQAYHIVCATHSRPEPAPSTHRSSTLTTASSITASTYPSVPSPVIVTPPPSTRTTHCSRPHQTSTSSSCLLSGHGSPCITPPSPPNSSPTSTHTSLPSTPSRCSARTSPPQWEHKGVTRSYPLPSNDEDGPYYCVFRGKRFRIYSPWCIFLTSYILFVS